jgi:cytoskeletal protein RodZ
MEGESLSRDASGRNDARPGTRTRTRSTVVEPGTSGPGDEDVQEFVERGPVRAGVLLRDARVRAGRSLEDCAFQLRSRTTLIDALEHGELEVFGGDIYARGFLRSYARLLGLDEEGILALHGRDPAFDAPVVQLSALRMRRDVPGWLVGLVSVVVLAVGLVTVLVLGGQRAPDTIAAVDPGLDAPTDGSMRPDPAPVLPVPPPAPEAVVGPPIDLVLTFEAASWLEVLIDGVPLLPSDGNGVLVPAGDTLRFTGQEEIVLRFGNAGGVRVESGGEDLGALGRSGEVLRVTFGPDGLVDDGG